MIEMNDLNHYESRSVAGKMPRPGGRDSRRAQTSSLRSRIPDRQGHRIRKTVYQGDGNPTPTWTEQSDTVFLYDGWNLIAELNANAGNTPIRTYVWGNDLSGSMQGAGGVGGLLKVADAGGGTSAFVAYDGNGNVMGLVNATDGALSARYAYGPFGEPLRATGVSQPFQFSTKYQDAETGLYYYGYRYYNPSAGRWPSCDPIGEIGGKNLCVFVLNNPLRYFDYLGLEGCNLSYSFDDDDKWWEKTAFPRNTKWLKTLEDAKTDIKQQLKTCCCIRKIYFTQHNGVPGIFQIGEGSIPINIVQRIKSETNARHRRLLQKSIQREQDFLKFVKKFMCKGGKIYFVQCQAGAGPEGEELKKWLQGLFGPNADVTLYAEDVRWFYGSPKQCKVKEK